MPNAGDLTNLDAQYRGLYVGRSGTGKKAAAASFPGRIKYFDIDQRINGLVGCPWVGRSNIDYDTYNPGDLESLKLLDRDLNKIKNDDAKGKPEFDMVLFCSLTGFTNGLMANALKHTHAAKKGKFIGDYAVPGPEDYGYEKIVTNQVIAAMRALKNTSFIVTAHVVARFGKSDPDNPYSDSVEVGEKLNITDKLGESVLIYFNEIYGFRKKNVGTKVEHLVKFRSDLYRTTFANLPAGEFDITGKNFYEMIKKYIT